MKEGNANGVRQAAHSLKGMVAGFDVGLAHGFAAELENLGKAGDLSKSIGLLSTLQREFARVKNHLKTADWREMN
jgi:hypothetical protein